MPLTSLAAADAAASLLAIVVSANGRIDPREVAALDRLGAYQKLGIQRHDFLSRAEAALNGIGNSLSQTRWLSRSDRGLMLALQREVEDPGLRLWVCRLSAAVIIADSRVTQDKRQVYASSLS